MAGYEGSCIEGFVSTASDGVSVGFFGILTSISSFYENFGISVCFPSTIFYSEVFVQIEKQGADCCCLNPESFLLGVGVV